MKISEVIVMIYGKKGVQSGKIKTSWILKLIKSSYNYGYPCVNPLMHYMGTSNSILLYSYRGSAAQEVIVLQSPLGFARCYNIFKQPK